MFFKIPGNSKNALFMFSRTQKVNFSCFQKSKKLTFHVFENPKNAFFEIFPVFDCFWTIFLNLKHPKVNFHDFENQKVDFSRF